MQADRGCDVKSPLGLLAKWSFWAAYNAFLQPHGTLVNELCNLCNREFQQKRRPSTNH